MPSLTIRRNRWVQIKVKVDNFPIIKQAPCYVSFIEAGNGLPSNRIMLVPELISKDFALELRSCCGYNRVDCLENEFAIEFDARFAALKSSSKYIREEPTLCVRLIHFENDLSSQFWEEKFTLRIKSHKTTVESKLLLNITPYYTEVLQTGQASEVSNAVEAPEFQDEILDFQNDACLSENWESFEMLQQHFLSNLEFRIPGLNL